MRKIYLTPRIVKEIYIRKVIKYNSNLYIIFNLSLLRFKTVDRVEFLFQ